MSYVLHDNPLSSNAQKVRFLLAELGQTAELREVPLAQPRPEWHLAVNPTGGIPAIVHDGFRLAESNTVLRYLATRSGDTQIYPSDLPDRATVNWLLDAITTVGAHPPGHAQIREWLARNVSGAEAVMSGSNAAAAAAVAAGELDAAAAAPVTGPRYGLVSLVPDIGEVRDAVTRFVLLRRPGPPPEP